MNVKRICLNCMREFDENAALCPYCSYRRGSPPRNPVFLRPGAVLNRRYLVGTVKGMGGFSIIYRAFDMILNRVVAVKEFYQSRLMLRSPGQNTVIVFEKRIDEYRKCIKDFLTEARTVSRFVEETNIVNVYDSFEENRTAYMVMELLEGESLAECLARNNGKLEEEYLIGVTLEMLSALEVIHRQNYIHRDISTKNIFLCRQKDKTVVKLIDFGTACFFEPDGKGEYFPVVTPGYAPYEQYEVHGNQGPWTDTYALGATLYKCVTGKLPPEGEARRRKDEIVPPKELCPELSDFMNSIIMRALSVSIPMRFRSTDEFRQALQKQQVVKTEKEIVRAGKTKRLIVSAAAIVTAAAVAGVGLPILSSQMNSGRLDEAVITAAVYAREGESKDAAEERFKAQASDFLETYDNVQLEITAYENRDAYLDAIQQALEGSGDLPVLFESDELDESSLVQCEDIGGLLRDVTSQGDYYGLNEYRSVFREGKQFPTSFQLPVKYVYYSAERADSGESASLSKQKEDCAVFEGQEMNIPGYFGTKCRNPSAPDEAETDLIHSVTITDKCEDFIHGEIGSLYGDTGIYSYIESETRGKLRVEAQDGSLLYAYFDGVYSISRSASGNDKKAARMLLQYLLKSHAQQTMNVPENGAGTHYGFYAMPLEKKAFRDYTALMGYQSFEDEAEALSFVRHRKE